MNTTVRTSSNRAYEAWKAAQAAVTQAGLDHANYHTAATKQALKAARAAEEKALENYSKSRLTKYAAVTDQQPKRRLFSWK